MQSFQRIGFDAVINGAARFVADATAINAAIQQMANAITVAARSTAQANVNFTSMAHAIRSVQHPLNALNTQMRALATQLQMLAQQLQNTNQSMNNMGQQASSNHQRLTGLAALMQRLIFVATGVATAMGAVALIRLPGQIVSGAYQAISAFEQLNRVVRSMIALELMSGSDAFGGIEDAAEEVSTKTLTAVRDINERISDAMIDHAERVQDIQRSIVAAAGSGLLEIQEKLADALESLAERHARTIANIQGQIAEATADFAEQQADRLADFERQMADVAERHAERRAELQEDLDNLNKEFSEDQADRQKKLQDRLSDIEGDHEKKRGDLVKRLYERTSAEKAQALLEGRLTEQEIYDLGLTDLAIRLKEEDEAYREQVATERKRAEDAQKSAQADHDKRVVALQQRIAKEDAEYQKQVATQQARYNESLARAQRDHDQRISKLQARIAEENAEYDKQRAKLQADAAKDDEDRQKKNAERVAELEEDLAKANRAYERTLRDLNQSLAATAVTAADTLTKLDPYKPSAEGAERAREAFEDAKGPADELVKRMIDLGIKTIYTGDQLANMVRGFMGFRVPSKMAEDLTVALVKLATARGLSPEQLNSIALGLSQAFAKGKLTAEEMTKQLANAGLTLGDLADAAQMTPKAFMKAVQAGGVEINQLLTNLITMIEERHGDAIENARFSWVMLGSTLGEMGPVLLREFFQPAFDAIQPYMARFIETISSKAFRDDINALGQRFREVLSEIKRLFAILTPAIQAFIDVFLKNKQFMSSFLTGLKALFVIFGAVVIAVIFAIIGAIEAVMYTIAAFGSALTAVYNLGKRIGVFLQEQYELITNFWKDLWENIAGPDGWVEQLVDGVVNYFAKLPDQLSEWLEALVTTVTTGFTNMVNGVMNIIGTDENSGLRGAMTSGWNAIVDGIMSIIGVDNNSGLRGMLVNGWNAIVDIGKNALNIYIDQINSVIDAWNSLNFSIPAITILGQTFGPWEFGTPDLDRIPRLARGVNFFPGGLAMVGELGPELVNLPRSSRVFSNLETSELLAGLATFTKVITRLTYNLDRPINVAAPASFYANLRGADTNSITNFNQYVSSSAPVDQTIANFRLMMAWAK